MIKCPCCKSSAHAVIGHDDTASLVTYRSYGKEVSKLTVMRLCMNCGTVYVAQKDLDTMKKEMEAELNNE